MQVSKCEDGVLRLEGYGNSYNDEVDLIDDQLSKVLTEPQLADAWRRDETFVLEQPISDQCTCLDRVVVGRIGPYEIKVELYEATRSRVQWVVSVEGMDSAI